MHWYYKNGNEEFGPITLDALNKLLNEGEISSGTMVKNADISEWMPYRDAIWIDRYNAEQRGEISTTKCSRCGEVLSESPLKFGDKYSCELCSEYFKTQEMLEYEKKRNVAASFLHASLLKRSLGYMIELVLLFGVGASVLYYVYLNTVPDMRITKMGETAAILIGVYMLYSLISEAICGRTFWLKWLGMRVVSRSGNRPGFGNMLLRMVVKLSFVVMPLFIIYSAIIYTDITPGKAGISLIIGVIISCLAWLIGLLIYTLVKDRTLHDTVSGTYMKDDWLSESAL